jgi:ATP-binding cassette subfamily B protein
MNEIDNEAQTRAVDSLLNYETVKYFGNERYEAARFDDSLARYERAAVRSQVTLNILNVGQSLIIAMGLSLVMLMAADEVRGGRMSVGQFVMANTYLMQLYVPLNFLGFVYRGIKQGLVDMEQMFRLLDVGQEVADRPDARPVAGPLAGAAPGAITFEDVWFGYRPSRASVSRCRPGIPSPSSAPPALANRRSPGCCSAFTMCPADAF